MVYDFYQNSNFIKNYDANYGNIIPNFTNFIFHYYYSKKDHPIIVPANHLYVLIDYGTCYIDGVNNSDRYVDPHLANTINRASDKSNQFSDVYTFLISLCLEIMVNKPYLIINEDNSSWNNTNLSIFYQSFFQNFEKLFKKPYKNIINDILFLQQNRFNYSTDSFYNYIISIRKEEFGNSPDRQDFRYLNSKFTQDLIGEDFKSSSNVVQWMTQSFYDYNYYKQFSTLESTKVFNFGFVPDNLEFGIQLDSKQLDNFKKHNKSISNTIKKIKNFEQ